MEFKQIIQKALELREEYAKLEKKKYGREWNRTEIAQGFVGDIGDLIKILMAKEGIRELKNMDEKLAHELADCLWSIIILSDKYGIDIEKAFFGTMDELSSKVSEQLEA